MKSKQRTIYICPYNNIPSSSAGDLLFAIYMQAVDDIRVHLLKIDEIRIKLDNPLLPLEERRSFSYKFQNYWLELIDAIRFLYDDPYQIFPNKELAWNAVTTVLFSDLKQFINYCF